MWCCTQGHPHSPQVLYGVTSHSHECCGWEPGTVQSCLSLSCSRAKGTCAVFNLSFPFHFSVSFCVVWVDNDVSFLARCSVPRRNGCCAQGGSWSSLNLSICLFASVCPYFSDSPLPRAALPALYPCSELLPSPTVRE